YKSETLHPDTYDQKYYNAIPAIKPDAVGVRSESVHTQEVLEIFRTGIDQYEETFASSQPTKPHSGRKERQAITLPQVP
ncbi:hypothetical protein KXW16_008550, partial [Aspergillus fumigatus]